MVICSPVRIFSGAFVKHRLRFWAALACGLGMIAEFMATPALAADRVALVIGDRAYRRPHAEQPGQRRSRHRRGAATAGLRGDPRAPISITRACDVTVREFSEKLSTAKVGAAVLRRSRVAGGRQEVSRPRGRQNREPGRSRLRHHRPRSGPPRDGSRRANQYRVPRCLPRQSAGGKPEPGLARGPARSAAAWRRSRPRRHADRVRDPARQRRARRRRPQQPVHRGVAQDHRGARPAIGRRHDRRSQRRVARHRPQAGAVGQLLADRPFLFQAAAASGDRRRQEGVEVTFWNSIKDSKNPQLFEAYCGAIRAATLPTSPRSTSSSSRSRWRSRWRRSPSRRLRSATPDCCGGARPTLRIEFRSGRGRCCRPEGHNRGVRGAEQAAANRRGHARAIDPAARDRRPQALGRDRLRQGRRQMGYGLGGSVAQERGCQRPRASAAGQNVPSRSASSAHRAALSRCRTPATRLFRATISRRRSRPLLTRAASAARLAASSAHRAPTARAGPTN